MDNILIERPSDSDNSVIGTKVQKLNKTLSK